MFGFLFLVVLAVSATLFQCGFPTIIAVIFFCNSSWSWFFKTASNCSVFSFSFFFFTNTHVRKDARLVFWCVRTSAVQQQNERAAREKRKGKEHCLFSSATRRRKEAERRRIICLLTLFVQHQAHPNSIDLQELALQPQFRVVLRVRHFKNKTTLKKKLTCFDVFWSAYHFFLYFRLGCTTLHSFFLFASLLFFSFLSSHVLAICRMVHRV